MKRFRGPVMGKVHWDYVLDEMVRPPVLSIRHTSILTPGTLGRDGSRRTSRKNASGNSRRLTKWPDGVQTFTSHQRTSGRRCLSVADDGAGKNPFSRIRDQRSWKAMQMRMYRCPRSGINQ